MRLVLHVDCDCFFAAVEMRDRPELRHIPIAIGGQSDRRGVISTCNYPARKFGVRSAMATAHALRLCPELKLLPGNMEKYKGVSRDVMEILRAYAVEFQQVSVDEAYLELPVASNADEVAKQIRGTIEKEVGITVSVGIAPNKFLAKVASDWQKPNGQFHIRPEDVLPFVSQLPVGKIPSVGPKSVERLNRLGIYTCEDVSRVGQIFLVDRFGQFGDVLYQRAIGRDSRPVAEKGERKSISIERTFAHDLSDPAEIDQVLTELWPKFTTRVQQSNVDRMSLAPFVKVKFADFQTTTLADHHRDVTLHSYRDLVSQAIQRQNKAIRLIGLGGRLPSLNLQQLPLF